MLGTPNFNSHVRIENLKTAKIKNLKFAKRKHCNGKLSVFERAILHFCELWKQQDDKFSLKGLGVKIQPKVILSKIIWMKLWLINEIRITVPNNIGLYEKQIPLYIMVHDPFFEFQ